MESRSTYNLEKRAKLWRLVVLWMLLSFAVVQLGAGESVALAAATPLEQSGLTSLWQENFTNGSIDRMQYTWSKGNNAALTSYVMPGAVFLGKDGGTIQIEQEINNFKQAAGEPLPSTIEFDVFSPNTGKGRVSLRPRRRGDMVTFLLGLSGDKTVVSFRQDAVDVPYNELTGPSRGWAHVVLSYRQFVQNGTTFAHFVVAINEEVKEHQAASGITNPDWATHWSTDPNADGWSIEHNSTEIVMGKYIANVRFYSEFLTLAQVQSRLQGRVGPYRSGLSDPRNYTGPKKAFQVHKTLTTDGPNAMAYAAQVSPLTANLDGSLSSGWDKITSYQWNFGDGQTGSGRLVNHAYAQAGTYNVTLTVRNEEGTESHTIPVTVNGTSNMTSTPTRTPTNTPLVTNTPTNTPISTPTRTPTNTPLPPTPTNTPTRTPTRTATPPPTSGPANLLANPGFELDANNDGLPDDWSTWNKFTRSNAVVRSGSFAGRFQATSDNDNTINQPAKGLSAGVTYNFAGWVNIPPTTDNFTFRLQVRWVDSAGTALGTTTVKTYSGPTNGWDQAAASLVAPAGTVKANIRMVVSSLNATIYVDDFSFGR